ncbi:MAG: AraC family transcriptional regulator [Spirochaetes bacterium]|nr:AraC family transcriptional regulator [Spirochaetota bacterium]
METFIKAAPFTVTKRFPEHEHPSWQFNVYLKGRGTLTAMGQELPFVPGRIICVPPHSTHREDSDGVYSDIVLWMSHCPAIPDKPHQCDDPPHKPLAVMAAVMLREYERADDGWQRRCSDMADVFVRYFRHYSSGTSMNADVESLKQKLLEHIADPAFSVEQAAAAGGFSAGHSNRLFRKYTGMSPLQYLIDARIRTAADLLRTEAMSIREIARMTGFADPYYFSRMFKKITGHSPRGYRTRKASPAM